MGPSAASAISAETKRFFIRTSAAPFALRSDSDSAEIRHPDPARRPLLRGVG